ncbi:MAG: phage holin family protein [Phocaeicola sp.]
MFSDKQNIDNLEELFVELKAYIQLRQEHLKFEIVEKITTLVSAILLALVLLILCGMVLFYFALAVAYILAPLVGGLATSFTIISGAITCIVILIILFRKTLIVKPLAKFLANLFLNRRL